MRIRLNLQLFVRLPELFFSAALWLLVAASQESIAQGQPGAEGSNTREVDVVLVLDNSGSMKGNDPGFLIKKAVTGFAESLNQESMLAIVVFDTNAKTILNLTKVSTSGFADLLGRALDHIDYSGQRTDIPGGLERALHELQTNGSPNADSVVVFLTDGIVDLGSRAKNTERSRFLHEVLLPELKKEGIHVYGVALSQDADMQLVQGLSSETEGSYHPVMKASELLQAFQKINSRIDQSLVAESGQPNVQESSPAGESGESPDVAEIEPSSSESRDVEAAPTGTSQAPEESAEASAEIQNEGESAPPVEDTPGNVQSGPASLNPPTDVEPSPQQTENMDQSFYQDIADHWVVLAISLLVVAGLLTVWAITRRRMSGRKASGEPEAFLVDISGEADEELRYALGVAPMRIGRSKKTNDIVIDQATVSSQHAIITRKNGKYYLRDLGSTNGTFINDNKVGKPGHTSEIGLNNHDVVSIARYKFQFLCEDAQSEPVPRRSSGEDQTMITPTIMVGGHGAPEATLTGFRPTMCPNHPEKIGNEVCTGCHQLYCTQCMEELDGRWLCDECRSHA
ncbi:MAG: FHA domain-containing protein [Gammaproteobacteria bacterium]